MKKLIVLFSVMLLTSCSYVEPNDIAYVVAIGFDKAEENDYKITIQFAKPRQISGGASEEGGKGGDIVENMTVQAPNIYSGINIANNILSKRFTLSHAKLVVFSREVAKEGLHEMVDTMIRSEELRPDVFLAVADNGANEYLESIKPVIEVNPAKYYHLIYEKNDSGGVPKSSLQQFYFEDRTEAQCSVIPLAGTIKTTSSQGAGEQSGGQQGGEGQQQKENESNQDAKLNKSGFEKDMKNYRAGEVAIQNANKGEAMGMAIFKDGKMIADLGGIESELYNMLLGTLERSFISFGSEVSKKPVTLRLDQVRRPKYEIKVKDRTIKIHVFLESDIYSLPVDFKTEQIDKFEEEAKLCIEQTCQDFVAYCRDTLDVDVLNLSNVAKRNFWTIGKYEEFDFENKFKEFDISVKAELEIRRSGMKINDN